MNGKLLGIIIWGVVIIAYIVLLASWATLRVPIGKTVEFIDQVLLFVWIPITAVAISLLLYLTFRRLVFGKSGIPDKLKKDIPTRPPSLFRILQLAFFLIFAISIAIITFLF